LVDDEMCVDGTVAECLHVVHALVGEDGDEAGIDAVCKGSQD
jgi:hypothetical protein